MAPPRTLTRDQMRRLRAGGGLRIGDRVPMPEEKLDIRPVFDGQSKSSHKPARKP